MEELERNPEMVGEKSIKLFQLPEIFNYHDPTHPMHDSTEVRKVRGEYKYFVWQNKSGLAWWNLDDQVNTKIINVMRPTILKFTPVAAIVDIKLILIHSLLCTVHG